MDAILKFFSVCSGLQINMGKSTIVGINVKPSLVQEFASSLGCEMGEWPLKYLDLPLGGNPGILGSSDR